MVAGALLVALARSTQLGQSSPLFGRTTLWAAREEAWPVAMRKVSDAVV